MSHSDTSTHTAARPGDERRWSGASSSVFGKVGLLLFSVVVSTSCNGNGSLARLSNDAPTHVREAVLRCAAQSGPEKQSCYESALLDRLAVAGVTDALSTLEMVAAADEDVERDGHVYTHAIGIEAYRGNPSLPDVFPECTTLFQSGCYHGVIQAHFMAAGEVDAEDIRGLCQRYKGEGGDRWTLFQCLHGLGHGLTMFYSHHLPRALEDCDLLTEWWDRQSCYGGAFMENIANATRPHHPAGDLPAAEAAEPAEFAHVEEAGGHEHGEMTDMEPVADLEPWKALDPDDPHYPCSVMEERYQHQCYLMQTSVILYHNGWDIAAAAETCDGAPESMRPICYQSLGRDISSTTLQDIDKSIDMCQLGSEEFESRCYVGLVKNFIDLAANTETAFEFCREVEGIGNKLSCYEAIGEEVAVLHAEEEARVQECRASEGTEFERACLYGARVINSKPTGL